MIVSKKSFPRIWLLLILLDLALALVYFSSYNPFIGIYFVAMLLYTLVIVIVFFIDREAILNPGAAWAHNRAWKKQQEGDHEDAKSRYDEIILIHPSFSKAYVNRGIILQQEGDFEGAISDFSHVIKLNYRKTLKFGYYNRAYNYYQQNKWDLALADLDTLEQLKLQFPHLHILRSAIYIKQKLFNQAIDESSKAIQIGKPSEIVALGYYNRACAYTLAGKLDEALEDCNHAIRLSPNLHNAYETRGQVYFLLKDYSEALKDFTEAVRLKPDFLLSKATQAITLHALGQTDEAKALWKSLIEQDANYRNADWLASELDWEQPFVNEAQKIISEL